jgi:carbamate kinase
MSKPILVVAVGGNALLQRGETMSCENQVKNIDKTTAALAELSERYRLVIVHGNGPQVGLLALQNLNYTETPPYPLDVLGAESQGMIGYLIEQGIQKVMPEKRCTTILTQIEVDAMDPAFAEPTKYIGPVYDEQQAQHLAQQHGWQIKQDGQYWRRVVPSPLPKRIVEIDSIQTLLNRDHIVICCGGGGAPVVREQGRLHGVEAVIDKDFAAAVLAKQLAADHFVILTDGENVCVDWGKPTERPLFEISADEIEQYQFAEGSMKPKVEACVQFARATSGIGHIGDLHKAMEITTYQSGTHIYVEKSLEPSV